MVEVNFLGVVSATTLAAKGHKDAILVQQTRCDLFFN